MLSKIRKSLILTISVLLIAAMIPMSAFAQNLANPGTCVQSIDVTGAAIAYVHEPVISVSNNGNSNNLTYTYNIELTAGTSANAVMTATFAKSDPNCTISRLPRISYPPYPTIPAVLANQSLTFDCTLSNGTGTANAYVFPNLTGDYTRFDTYVFNYSIRPLVNPLQVGDLELRFGDANYPNTAPECYMGFQGSGTDYSAIYDGPIPGFYPDTLSFLITDGADRITSLTSSGGVVIKVYNSNGVLLETGQNISTANMKTGFYVLDISAAGNLTVKSTGNSNGITISFSNPSSGTIPGGSKPAAVRSYMPIGQFANGQSWGDSRGKFITGNGYSQTGVSLGALGGYIEFEFAGGIPNDAKNPYGVDFVIYGNAFNGNPEPGAVQVSSDGITWYELAGSMYYDGGYSFNSGNFGPGTSNYTNNKYHLAYNGVKNNTEVLYTLATENIKAKLANANEQTFTSAVAWWPASGELYPMHGPHLNSGSNVLVNKSGDSPGSTLEFTGITAIPDYDTNASYAFGYVDVTPNGSPATYGNAVNPYTSYTSGKTGGDGFDLDWAVDIETGEPVNLNNKRIKYVRVYSAVLDNGFFGETSPEICGIFTTSNAQSSAVGRVQENQVNITIGGVSVTDPSFTRTQKGNVVIYTKNSSIASGTAVSVSTPSLPSSSRYVNSTYNGSYTTNSAGQTVRVVVQDGDKEPFIAIIKS